MFYIAKIHPHDQYTNLRLGQTNHALLTLVNTINEKHMYQENSPYSTRLKVVHLSYMVCDNEVRTEDR